MKILIVSADTDFFGLLGEQLAEVLPATVHTVKTVEEAISSLKSSKIDCLISDHNLPDVDGLAFLETTRAQYPNLPFILFTGHGDERVASKAISADVTEYLIKDDETQAERLASLIRDAVQYHRTRNSYHEREKRAKVLLDAAHDGIAVVRDGVFQYLNAAGRQLFGIEDETQVVGASIDTVVESITEITQLLERVQQGDQTVEQSEIPLSLVDGTTQTVTVTATGIEWNEQMAVALVIREVATSERTRQEHRQFRRAVEAAGHAIYITEKDGTITYVNPAFEEITGYSREEVLGERPSTFSSGEMSEQYYNRLWETLEAGEVWREEICNRRRSGELYYANQTIAPIRDWDGSVSQYVAIQTDITEQKATEQELRQYEQAVTGATDLIAAFNSDGTYLFANPKYCAYHGIDPKQVTTQTLTDALGEEADTDVYRHIERAFAGKSVRYRTMRNHPNRGERTLDVRYYPLRNAEEITGVVAVIRDVTDSTNRARQLRVVDRILRHNLRNALTAVRLRAEQMVEGTGDPAEIGAQIMEKVDSLLTTSRKSRNITEILGEQPQQQRIELAEMLDQLLVSVSEEYPDATFEMTAKDPLEVSATTNLRVAIEELLTNAILHHDREHPVVRFDAYTDGELICLDIIDDGPGIPEMDRHVLEQGKATGDLYHGSGLGLWLVFWIVQRSGGSISVSDAEPRGTVVSIRLPRAQNCSG